MSTACLDHPVWTLNGRRGQGGGGGDGQRSTPHLPMGKMVIAKNMIKVVNEVKFANFEAQATVTILQSFQPD